MWWIRRKVGRAARLEAGAAAALDGGVTAGMALDMGDRFLADAARRILPRAG
jgi:hypothetical protein